MWYKSVQSCKPLKNMTLHAHIFNSGPLRPLGAIAGYVQSRLIFDQVGSENQVSFYGLNAYCVRQWICVICDIFVMCSISPNWKNKKMGILSASPWCAVRENVVPESKHAGGNRVSVYTQVMSIIRSLCYMWWWAARSLGIYITFFSLRGHLW